MTKVINKLFSNSFFLMLGTVVATVFSFIYWLIIGKLLLPQDYGIISTTINFSSLLAIISVFGFNFAIVKLIPQYLEKGENKKINSLLKFSFKFMLFFGILIGLILALFSDPISGLVKLPKPAILVASVLVVFITIATFFDSSLRAFQKMKWVSIIQFFSNLFKVIVSVILIFLGFGYAGPLFGFIVLYIIMISIGASLIRFHKDSSKINKKQIIFKYSLQEFLASITSYVFFSGRLLILNIIKGPAITGIFSLAIIMTTPILLFSNTLLQAILPLASQLSVGKKSQQTLAVIIKHFIRYTLLVTLPLSIFLAIFAEPIILIFSRAEYISSSELFPIVATASILFALGNIFHKTLYTLGKTTFYSGVMIASVALFLIFGIILTYKFAAFGMSYAFLIFSAAFFILSFIKVKNSMEIIIPFSSIFKIILSVFISMSFLYFFTLITSGFVFNSLGTMISFVLYTGLLIALKFFEKDDIKIIKLLIGKLRFIKQ